MRNLSAFGAGLLFGIGLWLSGMANPRKVLDFLDVTVNPGTDTVLVRAVFENPERLLVSGQLVSVIAETGPGKRVLVVPGQALQLDQAGAFVLVVDKDSKIQVRRVDPPTGDLLGNDWVLVRGEGFDPGATVEFAGVPATDRRFLSNRRIVAKPPAHALGVVALGTLGLG